MENKNIILLHVVANESFVEFANNLQKEIESETGVKFGYIQQRLKKNYVLSPEFTALWDKISQKTIYRVKIDTEELVSRAVKSLKDMDELTKVRLFPRQQTLIFRIWALPMPSVKCGQHQSATIRGAVY